MVFSTENRVFSMCKIHVVRRIVNDYKWMLTVSLFFPLFFLHAEALNEMLFARFRYKWQRKKISFKPSCMSHLWLIVCAFVCKEMGKSVYMNVNHDEINLSLAYTWSTVLRCAHNNSIAISSDCDSPTI